MPLPQHIPNSGCTPNDEVFVSATLYQQAHVKIVGPNGTIVDQDFQGSYSKILPGDESYNVAITASDWDPYYREVGPCYEPTTTTSTVPATTTTVPESTTTEQPTTTTVVEDSTTTSTSPETSSTIVQEPSTTVAVPGTTETPTAVVVQPTTTVPSQPQSLPATGVETWGVAIAGVVAISLGMVARKFRR